jgi:RNA-directed DNA polymerase
MRLATAPLFQRLLTAMPFSETELALLILTAPTRYKEHHIQKRCGRGERLISQPTAELKLVQRWLVERELHFLTVDQHATAYRPKMSIRNHVEPHLNCHFLLKLDFKDFFPSLTDQALRHRLGHDANYSEQEVDILVNLLFRRRRGDCTHRLSIGAPSSPFISNYLMLEFDQRLATYCKTNSLRYTRYADDIAISSKSPNALDPAKDFITGLISEIPYLCLTLNPEKTVNVSKKYRRELVGLVISNEGRISLGRDEKHRLRAAVHAFINGRLSPVECMTLRGQLAFAMSVEREFVQNLCARHGLTGPSAIAAGNATGSPMN